MAIKNLNHLTVYKHITFSFSVKFFFVICIISLLKEIKLKKIYMQLHKINRIISVIFRQRF